MVLGDEGLIPSQPPSLPLAQKGSIKKAEVNILIVTIPLDHINVGVGMDILGMVTTARSVNIGLARCCK